MMTKIFFEPADKVECFVYCFPRIMDEDRMELQALLESNFTAEVCIVLGLSWQWLRELAQAVIISVAGDRAN